MNEAFPKILTRHWGKVDPMNLDSYRKREGYSALKKVLRDMQPQEVLEELKVSGLQGRGGAGFPISDKWQLARAVVAKERYFICNLDESEPGTFKDRMLAENNPHQIIEGMLIGAYAVGAKKAFIYLNGKFREAEKALQNAISQAYERNFLGRSILGFAFDVDLEIFTGAGAYICGEESALINSLEGFRGEPRLKPPFPCNCGFASAPTIVNNAETLSAIPWIIINSGRAFSKIGLKESTGTKLFSIDGAVNKPGLYEAPIGTSVKELLFDYAGGMQPGKEFWFAQVGGSSGEVVTWGHVDEKPSFAKNGQIPMGSGAVMFVDKAEDPKKLLLSWINFFQRESCGKCVPCREGTFRLKQIIERLVRGDFNQNDREDLDKLVWTLDNTTFCPLGKFSVVGLKGMIKHKLIKELS